MISSDETADYIFRVTYTGSDATTYDCPTVSPTINPTSSPSDNPSMTPTDITNAPTTQTSMPSISPTDNPSVTPTDNTNDPTSTPSNSPIIGTFDPSLSPSKTPTNNPTSGPVIISDNTQPTTEVEEVIGGDTKGVNVDFSDVSEFTMIEWIIVGGVLLLLLICLIIGIILCCKCWKSKTRLRKITSELSAYNEDDNIQMSSNPITQSNILTVDDYNL